MPSHEPEDKRQPPKDGEIRSHPAKHSRLSKESVLAIFFHQFRDDLFGLFNQEKYQEMLDKHCHKDVIATWQDGTTSKGHAGVLAEFAKLKKFIDKMTVKPNSDQRLILNDGKLVIASGNMKDDYVLSRGDKVDLESRWQATLVRENDRWVLVGFSASTNAFDNQVIDLYLKKTQYTTGGVALACGLAAGILATLLVARRRKL